MPRSFGTAAFVTVGVCLCTLFLLIYPEGELCRLFQYALVLLCVLFAWGYRSETLDGLLSLLALAFTAGADLFLVALKEAQWLPGMAIFCFAQLFWALRLLRMEAGRRRLTCLRLYPTCRKRWSGNSAFAWSPKCASSASEYFCQKG